MKIHQIATACGTILMLSALSVHAEPLDVKLGLWETTYTTSISGMPIPTDVLQGMPPEQRARLEAAMKSRQAKAPQSHTTQSCMTKEDLNRPFDMKDEGEEKNCTNTIVTATRTHAEYKIECTGPEARNGAMQIEALSRESMKATIKMNTGNGTVTNETTAKWIAADCGNVK